MSLVTPTSLLDVQSLRVVLTAPGGSTPRRPLVDDVSFSIHAGESVALVGESGSGKTLTTLALLGLARPGTAIDDQTKLWYEGRDWALLTPTDREALRGRSIALVNQEPLAALNPVLPIGDQIAEVVEVHAHVPRREAWARAVEALTEVGIADADRRARQYPHELSGGLRQRALMAMALVLSPSLLIADEPTTALDATVQAELLDRLRERRERTGMALLLVSHDLGLVAGVADRVLVMHAGRLVEQGPVATVFHHPVHAHTRALLAARPILTAVASQRPEHETPQHAAPDAPLLAVRDLAVHLRPPRRGLFGARPVVRAVEGVTFDLAHGETLALVGETGCGKSTTARAILRLLDPTRGTVHLDGRDLATVQGEALRHLRRRMQLVFQDAGSALDPRQPVGRSIAEALLAHDLASGAGVTARVASLLEEVGLSASDATRLPGTFSGGERQRIGMARALAVDPALLICDEPVSALDVVIQAQLLALLRTLQARRGMAMLFITHDLAVAARMADRVAVMYAGRLVEVAPTRRFVTAAQMPYTQALLSAVPPPSPGAVPERIILHGESPSPLAPSAGCPFLPRCFHPARDATCAQVVPPLTERAPGHFVACHKEPLSPSPTHP